MKKIMKCLTLVIVAISIFMLAACNSIKTDVKGQFMSPTIKTTEIKLAIEFDTNSKLENGSIKPYVSMYDKNDEYVKKITLSFSNSDYTSSTATFSALDINTLYKFKLFVTEDNTPIEIASVEYKTLSSDQANSEDNPYIITTVQDFKDMANEVTAHYKLANDIDFEGAELNSLFSASSGFSGSFDGQNHTISNFSLYGKNKIMGVFGYCKGATIKDLTITKVTGTKTSGECNSGVVAGQAERTTFTNIKVSDVDLSFTTSSSYVSNIGGFAGNLINCKVENCSFEDSIDSTLETPKYSITIEKSRGQVSCGLFAGLVENNTEIKNCFAKGNVKATVFYSTSSTISNYFTYVGGFIGTNKSGTRAVSDCYVVGDITVIEDTSKTGDLVKNTVISVGGFVGGNNKVGFMNMNNCLTIMDITAIIKYPEKGAVGGFAGIVDDNTIPNGIKIENCFYVSNDNGMDITCNPEATSFFTGLTIAKSNVDEAAISKVYSYNNKLTVTEGFTPTTSTVSTAYSDVLSSALQEVLTEHLN